MAGGRFFSAKEDAAIVEAVKDGARTEADFRPLGVALGRPYQTLRHRAIRLDLIEPRSRTAAEIERPAPRSYGWDSDDDDFLIKALNRGQSLREIALALGRSGSGVGDRVVQLGLRERGVREYAPDAEPDRSVQTAACAKHARACLKAGGFWAFSERRVGAGKWAVCLPMLPPPAHLWGAGQ
jgi:hypothetical protein